MYGPRTGGPGFWPPSPSLMVGADQHPKPGTVEYQMELRVSENNNPLMYLYELTYGRAGKIKYRSLVCVRALYQPPAKCSYCKEVHLSTEDAYDCVQEYIMLEVVTEVTTEPEYIRIAKERGHYNG